MISPEVMAKFGEFAATYSPPHPSRPETGERRVVPESFFWASRYPRADLVHIHRFHFSPAFGQTQYSWAGNIKQDIHFILQNGEIKLKSIELRGESYNQYSWIVDYSPEIPTQFGNNVGDDSLTIGYDKSGRIQTVAYHYEDETSRDNFFFDRPEIRKLRQNAEDDTLTLPVSTPNAQAVVVPISVDIHKIVGDIVDPVLFIDPFNAPPEVDDSWRNVHWPSIIGAKLIPPPNYEFPFPIGS